MKLFLFVTLTLCTFLYPQESSNLDSLSSKVDSSGSIDTSFISEDFYYEDEAACHNSYDFMPGIEGFGISVSKNTYFDKNLFNNPDKVHLKPDFSISVMVSMGIKYFLIDFDLRIAGHDIKMPSVNPDKNYFFGMASIGGRIKYIIPFERAQPYILASVSGVFGSVTFPDYDYTASFSGGTFGIGPGLSFHLTEIISLGFEGIMEFGHGEWKEKPFDNSTGIGVNLNNIRLQAVINLHL